MARLRRYHETQQLALPLPVARDAEIAITASLIPTPRALTHRSVAEMTARELLTVILGPRHAMVCEKLTERYEDFRSMAAANPAELLEHGCTTGTVERLSAVFEIAKRYGEHEFKAGEPLRGSGDVYAHYREHLAAE